MCYAAFAPPGAPYKPCRSTWCCLHVSLAYGRIQMEASKWKHGESQKAATCPRLATLRPTCGSPCSRRRPERRRLPTRRWRRQGRRCWRHRGSPRCLRQSARRGARRVVASGKRASVARADCRRCVRAPLLPERCCTQGHLLCSGPSLRARKTRSHPDQRSQRRRRRSRQSASGLRTRRGTFGGWPWPGVGSEGGVGGWGQRGEAR